MSTTDRGTADRQTGAVLLRRLRESRGWSWADLARALRDTAGALAITSLADRHVASVQRTVARWESLTDRTCPGERYQLLLAHLYAHTAGGELALGPGSDFDTLLDALRHFGVSRPREQRLRDLITTSAPDESSDPLTLLPPTRHVQVAAALRDRSSPDDELLAGLNDMVEAVNARVGLDPFVRLQLQLAPIVETCRRFLAIESNEPRRELLTLATTCFALAARLAFETRDDQMASSWYRAATDAARHLADRGHLAGVQTSHSMVTLHATDDVNAARTIARAATVEAHRGASYSVRARAHAVHAEICARAGQTDEARAALARAWKTVDQLAVDDPHGGFNADRLHGFDGLCALYTGEPDRAHDRLDRSMTTLTRTSDAVQRGIVGTDLALARLRLGDPAACAELMHEAVDITATTGGRVSAQRIRKVRRELRPWRAENFLTDLDDHIHDSLIGK